MYEPLSYPEGWTLELSRLEKLCCHLPGCKAFFTAIFENRKIAVASHHVRQQIEARKEEPSGQWSDEQDQQIAQEIATICKEIIGWANDHFIPDDPFAIMIDLRIGDIVEVEAIQKIEQEFHVDFKPLIDDGSLWEMTFNDIVKRIRSQGTRL